MKTHLSLHNLALFSLVALVCSLPFEAILFSAGPLQISSLELLLALVLLSTVGLVAARHRRHHEGWLRFPRSWLALWAIVALALALSTLLTPEYRLNAAKGSARLLAGMALAISVPQIVRRRWHVVILVAALLLGGLLAAGAGLIELSTSIPLTVLDPFRDAPTTAGAFMRLTGSFDHANQAAMYLEATAPLLVAVLIISFGHRSPVRVALTEIVRRNGASGDNSPGAAGKLMAPCIALFLLATLFIWLQAVIATYSRAALIAVVASSLAILVVSSRRRGLWPFAALGVTLVVFVAFNALFDPVVRMRWQTEGDNEWYQTTFDAPAALTVDAGHTVTTTISVRNDGILTWSSEPPFRIRAGGHWYSPDTDSSLAYRPRWVLPQTVHPGETLTMQVALLAPLRAGHYEFRWDIVQEDVTWFSYKTGVRTSTSVTVLPASSAPIPRLPETEQALNRVVQPPPDLAPIPDRRTLWRIAFEESAERPLLGIGMDNFRLIHGRTLGYEQWNETIHTNNWYMEMLVSIGLLGTLPFLGWMVLLGLDAIRTLRRRRRDVWHVALAAGLMTFYVHGVFDYFLSANGTGLLFWLLCGLWVAIRQFDQVGHEVGNAHWL